MSKHTRDELLYLAKLAEQCERYDGKIGTLSGARFNFCYFIQRWLNTPSSLHKLVIKRCASRKGIFCQLPSKMSSGQGELHGASSLPSKKRKTTKVSLNQTSNLLSYL